MTVEGEGADTDSDAGSEASAEVEARARTHGWRPKEEYKGDEGKFVGAEAFLARIDTETPVKNERMASLERQNRSLQRELKGLRDDLKEARETMEEVRVWSSKAAETAYAEARERVQQEMEAAFEKGDKTAFNRAQRQAADLDRGRDRKSTAVDDDDGKGAKKPEKKPDRVEVDPVLEDWAAAPEQAWYRASPGMQTWAAARYDIEAAKLGRGATLEQILGAVRKAAVRMFPDQFEDEQLHGGGQKVLDPAGGGRSGGGKKAPTLIKDLPSEEQADAKAAFARWKRQMPDYKEEDYVKVYLSQERR